MLCIKIIIELSNFNFLWLQHLNTVSLENRYVISVSKVLRNK